MWVAEKCCCHLEAFGHIRFELFDFPRPSQSTTRVRAFMRLYKFNVLLFKELNFWPTEHMLDLMESVSLLVPKCYCRCWLLACPGQAAVVVKVIPALIISLLMHTGVSSLLRCTFSPRDPARSLIFMDVPAVLCVFVSIITPYFWSSSCLMNPCLPKLRDWFIATLKLKWSRWSFFFSFFREHGFFVLRPFCVTLLVDRWKLFQGSMKNSSLTHSVPFFCTPTHICSFWELYTDRNGPAAWTLELN